MINENCLNIDEISLTVGSFAIQAILYEASCFPSPGLVSPVSTGSHKDMDYFMFLDSTAVLSKYLAEFVRQGLSDRSYRKIFEAIREIGKKAEAEMFLKTNGINTHKGALFLMGLACAAVGKAIYDGCAFEEIQNIIRSMTKGIVQRELMVLENRPDLTHGEEIYLKYKYPGVRGEAAAGIPAVFNYSLDFFRQNSDMTINDRLVQTLIAIMSHCEDSTIVYRHNPETLDKVKARSRSIIDAGGMKSHEGRALIDRLCEDFIKENISPGGSADLLGVTVFLDLAEQYMSRNIRII
ncbi:triphosphoribosyl-dephospho-CoA synthase CitG [Paenibacillus sp. J2TS4]|uniref:triphosphoribosyl-dephospho-CoA synthase CitG n=1 Tax=Paenibacillus sp. J2TS4 TaxID=2807194 RepID=UPI001B14A21F|nr:triphosphoribosyl-dephospho-CoA synthase CitG [Paenibacillus sp. J2TS4]GIP31678.1 putative 2-(5''-triphosphoribosyl)-3'-dephosphocoenzyme-A synthase [Paenibacillus sp. J2TS4]